MTALWSPLTNQTPTAAQFATLVPRPAAKLGDTARASTTSLTADPDLSVAVDASVAYKVELQIQYTQGATGQLVVAWSAPSGATLDWSAYMLDQGVTAGNVGSIRPLGRAVGDNLTMGGNLSIITTALVFGRLVTSTTAGTLSLTWAQSVSNATAVTVKAGSFMVLTQIA